MNCLKPIILISLFGLGITNCTHKQSITDELIQEPEMPSWLNQDCLKVGEDYLFVGFGKGEDASSAIRSALISSRKNALTCIFGGTITANIEVSESNESIEYTGTTHVELNYEHVNWAGYEQVQGRQFFPKSGEHQVYSQYKWSIAQVVKEQERLKSLAKKIEENKALKNEVELSKEISAEKEALIKQQKVELEQFKQHEKEIENLRSNKARVLAKLAQMKKRRNEKGKEFVDMVTNMGCDVTYDDLVELIGEAEEIEVRGICYKSCKYELIAKWVPVIIYKYGSYAINAYVQGTSMTGTSDWYSYVKYQSEAQIVDMDKIKGTRKGWWICKEGYDFVKKLLRS